ncbi:cellulose synthase/poly-beta-1,6-N-acetylglucosamine synthase-like glycosyltransferase [Weissella uvarum]|uniref:glycosyltransferase family 2 protein n=1 Tax=Weissella uvarum TaxID=1479233 RepID=UPI00196057BB|nr:glycosyltransferase family 2 protein [Weissella uvarum]MBM7617334.1 cellulose synthase/poly-beta-1,6-N-acetylglucosamine synthase-like glycosyltransferase [Weissella uvarum]MCM0595774.1 glycosyltransferase [Weissella uvarum]
MSIIITIESLYFNFYKRGEKYEDNPNLSEYQQSIRAIDEQPFVSLLVPCYNESDNIEGILKTIDEALDYDYLEVILINDGSTDNTAIKIRTSLMRMHLNKEFRFVDIEENMGKENVLLQGALATKGEFLMVMDTDAILDVDAIKKWWCILKIQLLMLSLGNHWYGILQPY